MANIEICIPEKIINDYEKQVIEDLQRERKALKLLKVFYNKLKETYNKEQQ